MMAHMYTGFWQPTRALPSVAPRAIDTLLANEGNASKGTVPG